MKIIAALLVLLVILAGILGPQAFYTVDETQVAIVTRFGEFRKARNNPGLYVKTPFIDTVRYFDGRNTLFDAAPDSLLTKDKKRLIIDAYAIGRIDDPLVFFQRLRTETAAVNRTVGIIASEIRREIALDDQSEIIRTNREEIMGRVTAGVASVLEATGVATPGNDGVGFGIKVIDARTKRIDFPVEIAESIYARMRAERQRIADAERAEGAKADLELRANVDRRATIIRAEAERDSNILRGSGEAEAIDIFADALQEDPEFYSFQRSLEAYKNFLTQNATVVLPADSPLFQFLQNPMGNVGSSESNGTSE